MDTSQFWAIIETARRDVDGDWMSVPAAVVDTLAALPLSEIADFSELQDRIEWSAYRDDLWAACVLINGGFGSDDGFLYFRNWLIVQGRDVFEAALANPDSLAELDVVVNVSATGDDFAACEALLYVADEAWGRITGNDEGLDEELQKREFDAMRDCPVSPAGPRISFEDRDQVFATLPRLAQLFYARAAAHRAIRF